MYITIAKIVSDFVFPAVVFNALHAHIHLCHLPPLDTAFTWDAGKYYFLVVFFCFCEQSI